MISLFNALLRPVLFRFEPEGAHRLSINALRLMPPVSLRIEDPRLRQTVCGLDFPNPLGLAAGYDKGGEVPDALLRLGFGAVEAGTITPRPQPGNPQPRLFRLTKDEAVINRLGFNSEGSKPPFQRLAARRGRSGIVGVNVGSNKETTDRAADYIAGIMTFAEVASYFTVNISSPNTPGLRDLQQAATLDDLLARVLDAREQAAARHGHKPVFLKIAPDLSIAELDDVIRVARARRVDALILGNTTISRPPGLHEIELAGEAGGLTGRPLFELSTRLLAAAYLRVEGQFPLVGVGGIDGPDSAFVKMEAGATLIQLYSSMVFKGPGLPNDILRGLLARLDAEQIPHISQVTGRRARDLAGERA